LFYATVAGAMVEGDDRVDGVIAYTKGGA